MRRRHSTLPSDDLPPVSLTYGHSFGVEPLERRDSEFASEAKSLLEVADPKVINLPVENPLRHLVEYGAVNQVLAFEPDEPAAL